MNTPLFDRFSTVLFETLSIDSCIDARAWVKKALDSVQYEDLPKLISEIDIVVDSEKISFNRDDISDPLRAITTNLIYEILRRYWVIHPDVTAINPEQLRLLCEFLQTHDRVFEDQLESAIEALTENQERTDELQDELYEIDDQLEDLEEKKQTMLHRRNEIQAVIHHRASFVE